MALKLDMEYYITLIQTLSLYIMLFGLGYPSGVGKIE